MTQNLKNIIKNSRIAFENKVDPLKKNKVLRKFSNLLIKNKKKILEENYKDIIFAKKKKFKGKLN